MNTKAVPCFGFLHHHQHRSPSRALQLLTNTSTCIHYNLHHNCLRFSSINTRTILTNVVLTSIFLRNVHNYEFLWILSTLNSNRYINLSTLYFCHKHYTCVSQDFVHPWNFMTIKNILGGIVCKDCTLVFVTMLQPSISENYMYVLQPSL